MSASTVLARMMFKPAPGGYVFQPVPPTRFHDTDAYLVSESQKAAILAIYGAGRAARGRLLLAVSVALALMTGVGLYRHDAPGLFVAFIFLCVGFIAQVAGFAFLLHLKLRELQPILADLPRSNEKLFAKISRRELLIGNPPPLLIALYCGGFGFWLGSRFQQHPPFQDVTSTLVLCGLTLNIFWATRIRRAKPMSPIPRER